MREQRMLAFVMAGGEGSRLYPLTANRSKPSVSFGGRYRIVDFVLSNMVNSEIYAVYLLVQYKSQSLIEHIRRSWVLSPIISDHFVTVVPPQMLKGTEWFQGTADAVYQNIRLIKQHNVDLVAVFGADHIYRMDIQQMVRFHREQDAEASVAALPVPIERASDFGVIVANEDGRVREFQEKPEKPVSTPTDPGRSFASMGNYIFNTEVLLEALEEAKGREEHDFGRHVLPRLAANRRRLFAYDFSTNLVPGVKPYEESAYWRDVGTLETFFEAHQDMLGLHPRFDVFNSKWPITSSNYQGPVAMVVSGEIRNSILGAGTIVKGASVRNSVVRREVTLEEDVEIEDCVIMDYTVIHRGSRLRRVIVDRHNVIAAGSRIGFDREEDQQRHFVSSSGLVVIPQGPPAARSWEAHG